MRATAIALALLAGVAANVRAQEAMGWQEAVVSLASERTRAEACVSLLKAHAAGQAQVLTEGEYTYTQAKADMDGVIAGLVVALAEDAAPLSFDSMRIQLEQAVALRQAFCEKALALAPPEAGTKTLATDLLGKVLSSLVDAAKEIYLKHNEDDALARKTIQTQVEGTRWRAFGEIPASGT
jgi:hypothetical protein